MEQRMNEQKFQEILTRIYTHAQETKEVEVKALIEDIKKQIISAFYKSS